MSHSGEMLDPNHYHPEELRESHFRNRGFRVQDNSFIKCFSTPSHLRCRNILVFSSGCADVELADFPSFDIAALLAMTQVQMY